jgi:hypothetical protein
MRGLGNLAVAVALSCGVALAPVAAQAQSYSAARMISSIDDATFTATLGELGATWETEERDDGSLLYAVSFENGLNAFAYFRACSEDGETCQGLALVAPFDAPDAMTDAQLNEKIRQFNDTYPAGKAFLGTGQESLVQAYVIMDEGISMANLRVQIDVFVDVCDRYAEHFED